jgi:hypothetical protein
VTRQKEKKRKNLKKKEKLIMSTDEQTQFAIFEKVCDIQCKLLLATMKDVLPENYLNTLNSAIQMISNSKHFIFITIVDVAWVLLSPHEKDIEARNPEVWTKITIPGDVSISSIVYSEKFTDDHRVKMLRILSLVYSMLKAIRDCMPKTPMVNATREAIDRMSDPTSIQNANSMVAALRAIGVKNMFQDNSISDE